MNTFEITIHRPSGDVYPVVVETSAPGALLPVRSEGTLALDLAALRPLELDAHAYGMMLGQALFRDQVRDAFVRACAASGDPLHVLLSIEPADLKVLRWERLCAPLDGRWSFLALDQRVPFSMYLPSLADQRFPPIGRRDLRALIIAASPTNLERYRLAPFDAASAAASVQAALGEIPCDVLTSPTLDALCERITAERYTLLHVVCHGQMKQGETVLYLENQDNQVDPVTASRFIERLGQVRGARGLPHFVFLSTCESAAPEAEGALGSLAQRLVRELGMPAVLAMTDRVTVATAQALAEKFYARLREHGAVDCALVQAVAGLAERTDITVPALYSRLGGRPLYSDALDRPLTNAEIRFGMDRLTQFLAERAPALAAGGDSLAPYLDADPAGLAPAALAERERALAAVNALCEETLDLSFNALALGKMPPTFDGRCPFRGLYPFREQDREFFFGREALVEQLQQRLAEHKFLAVLGPSGSGKSSLVMAGLVPALSSREPDLSIACLTPGADPLAQMQASLATASGDYTLSLVIVDQFEELFTLCRDEEKRRAFIARLLTLAQTRRVVITLRADFWGECAPYRELKQAMQAHQELIAPMDESELRRAMELQAAKVGLRFESDLSSQILDDVRGEPGAMPLLQHALLELWKRRHGRWLRAAEYRALGGVSEAIARTADELYGTLDVGDRERVRNIFVRLTRVDEEVVPGEERRDTRRRVGAAELVPAGNDPAATQALVERLATARLVVTSVNAVTGHKEVEVAHEALIRYWPRLRDWLDADRANLRLREGIRECALEWQAGNRDEALLVHRGGRLEDAVALSRQARWPLNELERNYVQAAADMRERERAEKEAQQERELEAARELAQEQKQRAETERRARVRQRYFSIGLSTLLVVACVFLAIAIAAAGFASTQRDAATHTEGTAVAERNRAQDQTRKSDARRLAAQSSALRSQRYDLSLLLAVEAWRMDQNLEIRGTLLDTLASNPQVEIYLRGSRKDTTNLAFSPDGKILAAGGEDNEIILWDMTTRQPIGSPLRGHTGAMSGVVFSPDGKLLASAGEDKTIILWDMSTRRAIGSPLTGHTDTIESIGFSPDGKLLVSASDDKTLILWDVSTRRAIGAPFKGHTLAVVDAAFSPDGKLLASAGADKNILLWDLNSRSPIGAPLTGHTDTITTIAYSPDGKRLASGSKDSTIRFWDVDSRRAIGGPLTAHSGPISVLQFSPDGKRLASGSWDWSIVLWDANTLQPIGSPLKGQSNPVTSLAFTPDGKMLASSTWENEIILWDLNKQQRLGSILKGHTAPVGSVVFSPDGKLLASAGMDKSIRLWDVRQQTPIGEPLQGNQGDVYSLAFSPDGKLLASGNTQYSILLWDVGTHQPVGSPLKRHSYPVRSLAFSPDGKLLVSGSQDSTIVFWDMATRQVLGSPLREHSNWVNSVAFSPDGKLLASGSSDKTIILWDANTRQPRGDRLTGHGSDVMSLAFSPDGKWLASGSVDSTILLWNVATQQRDGNSFAGHADVVMGVAFSPDGKTLASASYDKTVMLWDVETRQPIGGPLKGHQDSANSVAFSPDGKFVASASDDGTVILWDVDVESWIARACRIANRNLTRSEWATYIGGNASTYRATCPGLPLDPYF